MRHNRRDDGQLSCRKREMKTMNANTALDGHTTVIKMAERGGVPLIWAEIHKVCATLVFCSQHSWRYHQDKRFIRKLFSDSDMIVLEAVQKLVKWSDEF